jgi:MoxR-like ATPase
VDPQMQRYIVHIVGLTRDHPDVYLGASPRGSLALMRAAQSRAMLAGRDYVMPDDIKVLAAPALAHRLIMSPEARMRNATAPAVIAQILQEVPVPGSRVPA